MFNKGDLVYVPSQVTLLQYDSLRVPKRLEKTSKPGHAIIAENDDAMNGQYKILYGGEYWYAGLSDLYYVSDGGVDDHQVS
jgi:hypothetical protein